MFRFETIRVEVDEQGVATLKLARPEKHNAMNASMIEELTRAALILGADPHVRVVILAAEGKTFCAGGDLAWMREQAEKDRVGKMAESGKLAKMLATLNDLPKPLLGRVQGPAFGGGIGLMAVCDSVYSVREAHFVLSETRLGLIPATIGPFVVRRIGEGFARQIFFTAKPFDADFAFRIGLVSQLCSQEELDDAIEIDISHILRTFSGAAASAKSLCLALGDMDRSEMSELTAQALADCWESHESVSGIRTFLESKAR